MASMASNPAGFRKESSTSTVVDSVTELNSLGVRFHCLIVRPVLLSYAMNVVCASERVLPVTSQARSMPRSSYICQCYLILAAFARWRILLGKSESNILSSYLHHNRAPQ